MKRIFIIISLLSLACAAKAENDFYTEFKQKVTEALKYVDRGQFTTGLLSDYGFSWVDYSEFDGSPNDSLSLNYDCWKAIYGGLYDSRVNSNVDMPELETVISSLEKNKSVGILYYKYDRFREDALEKGLITNDDGYIRIVDGKPSPFEQQECFAVSPPINRQDGLTLSLLFNKETYYTNTNMTIVGIDVDFDGTGYRTAEWDKPIEYTYTTEGAKEIKFRIEMTAGSHIDVYESKCVVSVRQQPDPPKRIDTNLAISYKAIPSDGNHAGGVMEIVYAANGTLGGKNFIRPLIIVGDMDLSALSPDLKMTLKKLLETGGISPSLAQLNKIFDIVYINYNNGLDNLIRNGEMVRQAIKEIQANQSALGCDQSYVIGLGMGGVVARIALNKMEMAGESHNVRKLIAVNSPFQGINVPIGLQFSIQHLSEFIRRIEVKTSKTIDGFANIQKIANLLDQPAFKQLLTHRINKSFEYDNSEHDNFMLYKIFLAKPENCESVAIATGYMRDNYGDRLFQPYSDLLAFAGDMSEWVVFILLKANVDVNINAKSLPKNEVKTIYSGELKFRLKVLAFINVGKKQVTLRNSFNSTADMNPIDGTNGCYIPMNLISGNDEFISSLLKVDKFCFLPTYSALDIADEDAYFKGGGINIPFDRYYLDSGSKSYSDNSYMIDYLMKEIMPAVGGDIENILDDTELYVDNVPDIPGLPIQFNWNFKNGNFRVVSQDGNKAVVRPLAYGEFDYADTVSVNISVNLPILNIPPMSTPAVRITPHTIRIDGSSYITAGAQTFELDTLPKNAGAVEWAAGENIKVSRQGEKSATAYATEYSEDAWIEASFAVGDDRYNIRKDLIASRLDSVTGMKMEQTWWDKEVAADKYFFKVELYPIYMPPQEIHFCWSNTVRIYDKDGNLKRENDSNDDDDRFPPTMVDPGGLVVDYGFMGNGMAEIETPGDVGICQFAVEYPGGPAIPADSLIFGREGGYDHLIMPTSTDYPPGEIDPIITIPALTGPNCAIVTMPALGTDLGDYAAGEIRCDISDDYGNRYRVSYYVRSERGVVYHNYSVSPNPTSDRLDVKMKVEGDASMSEPSPMTVKLYGDTGLVREATFDDPVAGGSIDVSNLPEGTYYMNLEINGTVVKRQVVLIQR